jgi:3-oxoacyl-[acyl-carrier protein] reductase
MNLQLKDKVALVTGSGQGLGLGIAEGFLKEDAKVVLTDLHKERLQNAVNTLKTKYHEERISWIQGDLTKTSHIQGCVKHALGQFGRIDVLIANLGSGRGSSDWNISEEDWMMMLEINFNGARRIVNEVLPGMLDQGSGSVVFIASIAGIEVIGAPIHYSVAKSAVVAYSKNLARKVARNNVRVNVVCPGNIFFQNGTWDIKMKEDKDGVLEMLDRSVPQNRFAEPEDISNLVVFISSNKASFITGACIVADGGQTVAI